MKHRNELVKEAARQLHRAKMIKYDRHSGAMDYTEIGRIASHLYIKRPTIEHFNSKMRLCDADVEILALVSRADEFKQVKVLCLTFFFQPVLIVFIEIVSLMVVHVGQHDTFLNSRMKCVAMVQAHIL